MPLAVLMIVLFLTLLFYTFYPLLKIRQGLKQQAASIFCTYKMENRNSNYQLGKLQLIVS
jgi:hypothetical protein